MLLAQPLVLGLTNNTSSAWRAIVFHKLLVAMEMDSSERGHHVFDEAVALAKALNASLLLLHVLSLEEDSPGAPGMPGVDYYPWSREDTLLDYRKQWDTFESECLELLRSRTNEAIAAGITAEFAQLPGSVGEIICNVAHSWGADLIIMGRRGRTGLSELILGSVSNYVLHHAPCSVVTVQSPG
ncbi:MAG TPA: universal stress protein [Cyanophyceae cyanobacterium]